MEDAFLVEGEWKIDSPAPPTSYMGAFLKAKEIFGNDLTEEEFLTLITSMMTVMADFNKAKKKARRDQKTKNKTTSST